MEQGDFGATLTFAQGWTQDFKLGGWGGGGAEKSKKKKKNSNTHPYSGQKFLLQHYAQNDKTPSPTRLS